MFANFYRPLYFRSGRFFHQFLELAVLSYPSPLDEDAPFAAKALLLAIAGALEFFPAAWAVDIISALFGLLVLLIAWPTGVRIEIPDWIPDPLLLLVALGSFAFRLRRFARCARGPGRRVTAGRLAASFFWHSPALVYYGVLQTWSLASGRGPLRIWAPRQIWVLLAPNLELGEIQQSAVKAAAEQRLAKLGKGWGLFLPTFGILTIPVLKVIVELGPSLMISVILWAQSWAYWASLSTEPRPGSRSPWIVWVLSVFEFLATKMNNVLSPTHSWAVSVVETGIGRLANLLATLAIKWKGGIIPHDGYIGPRYIRLLTILPSSREAPIQCFEQWHDVGLDPPPYSAISYCWGPDDTPNHQIRVNGAIVLVPRAALEVLVNMRSLWRPQTVWIDAVCIDQTNSAEKARQIPLMPRIYRSAREVVVWLGSSETATLATDLVNRLFLVNRLQETSGTRFDYEIPVGGARALDDMLRRPWFSRVWVVQEVVLPAPGTTVTVLYGDAALPWERLSWFAQVLLRDQQLSLMLAVRSDRERFAEQPALRHIGLMRRFSRTREEAYDRLTSLKSVTPDLARQLSRVGRGDSPLSLPFYLAQMFRSGCSFDCKEAHDRIYGLLGLTTTGATFPAPDYGQPLRSLFTDVVRHTLQQGDDPPVRGYDSRRRLDFLAHAGTGYHPQGQKYVPQVPSWVPDWTLAPPSQPLFGTDGAAELLASSDTSRTGRLGRQQQALNAAIAGLSTRNKRLVLPPLLPPSGPLGGLLADAASLASFAQFDAEPLKVQGTPRDRAMDGVTAHADAAAAALYDVAPGTAPAVRLLDDVLELQGCRWDRIAAVGGDAFPVLEPADWMDALRRLRDWTSFVKKHRDRILQAPQPEAKGPAAPNTLACIFFALLLNGLTVNQVDYTFTSTPQPLETVLPRTLMGQLWDVLHQGLLCRPPKKGVTYVQVLERAFPGIANAENMVMLAAYTLPSALRRISAGRCIVVTEKGYLGLFLPGSSKGDEVMIFSGTTVPFVLRERGGWGEEGEEGEARGRCYELIGPGYVQGIMNGGATVKELRFEPVLVV